MYVMKVGKNIQSDVCVCGQARKYRCESWEKIFSRMRVSTNRWENVCVNVEKDIPPDVQACNYSVFHISHAAAACNTSISCPFFTIAPCSRPSERNFVSSGL